MARTAAEKHRSRCLCPGPESSPEAYGSGRTSQRRPPAQRREYRRSPRSTGLTTRCDERAVSRAAPAARSATRSAFLSDAQGGDTLHSRRSGLSRSRFHACAGYRYSVHRGNHARADLARDAGVSRAARSPCTYLRVWDECCAAPGAAPAVPGDRFSQVALLHERCVSGGTCPHARAAARTGGVVSVFRHALPVGAATEGEEMLKSV